MRSKARSFRQALAIYSLMTALCQSAQAADSWQLDKVQMVSRTQGWALAHTSRGSVLLKTSDGGRNWRNVSPREIWPLSPSQVKSDSDMGEEAIDVFFLSAHTGWVAMKGFHTQVVSEAVPEGGRHWIKKWFADPIVVERTQDGGKHWAASRFLEHSGVSLRLSFLDTRRGFLLTISDMASGSTRKTLYRTRDGGRTWAFVTQSLPDHIDPTGLTFRSPTEGWLSAGYHGSDAVPFYQTNDAGRHWHLQALAGLPLSEAGYAVTYPLTFIGAGRREGVLAVRWEAHAPEREGYVLYGTQNRGRSWRLARRLPPRPGLEGAAIQFIDRQTGWTLRDAGLEAPTLWLTQDGGRRWHIVYPPKKEKP